MIPSTGPACGGTKIVILGTNFIDNGNLLVKVGESLIVPKYHEPVTIIFTSPPGTRRTTATVSVSNNGKEFAKTNLKFMYY